MDSGFAAGQAAALKALAPAFGIVKIAVENHDMDTLHRVIKHPKRFLQETTGELLELKSFSESKYALLYPNSSSILHKCHWRLPANDETGYVSTVKLLNIVLIAVGDESHSIARTQAASLVAQVLERNPDLKNRLIDCQSKIASRMQRQRNKRDVEL